MTVLLPPAVTSKLHFEKFEAWLVVFYWRQHNLSCKKYNLAFTDFKLSLDLLTFGHVTSGPMTNNSLMTNSPVTNSRIPIPQGSVLAPHPYILYTADIVTLKIHDSSYADDTHAAIHGSASTAVSLFAKVLEATAALELWMSFDRDGS